MENFKQLCVWPGTLLEENQIQDFVNFFQEDMGVRVEYKTTLVTRPDLDERGRVVPETGGRHDVFFYVHDEDVMKCPVKHSCIPSSTPSLGSGEDISKICRNATEVSVAGRIRRRSCTVAAGLRTLYPHLIHCGHRLSHRERSRFFWQSPVRDRFRRQCCCGPRQHDRNA